jgi:hypothetical protein
MTLRDCLSITLVTAVALAIVTEYISLQVYLGEQYVNSSTLSDVNFLVEGWYYFRTDIISSYFKYAFLLGP